MDSNFIQYYFGQDLQDYMDLFLVNFTSTGGTDKSDGDFNFGHKSDSVLSPQYRRSAFYSLLGVVSFLTKHRYLLRV